MRQAQFSAREDDTLSKWIIQFTLAEKLPNPEKTEQRRAANGTNSQTAPGDSVAGSGSNGSSALPELTGFENALKKVDGWLGGDQK